jgi:beta-galactosidase GanA
MSSHTFPYGASYSPLIFDEAEWDHDLKLMKDASMNLIRVGDVHGSWDRLEPREGKYDFGRLGRFYKAAEKYGHQILLSNGAACPPLWLKTKHPDVSLLSSREERYPLGSSYHWSCIHHPGYIKALRSYTEEIASFAIQKPNHFGWQISNEIGFPFMPAREENELGLYCYCDHCQKEFQGWLKEKYSTLENLTEAWSWSTTNFVYNKWEEAVGPESLPSSWSGVTRWIDWRLFWQDAFAEFAGWQHNLIRQIDKEHPTSINTFNFKGFDRFGTFMGLDQWKIARKVDHIGYDLYPGSGNKLKTRPEHNSMFLDHGRSVALSTGRDFWLHELESGPIGGWLMGPQHNTNPVDIENYIIESLGHNGKLLIYMPWREWGYQPIRWGALVDLKGNPTPRLQAASKLGKFMQEHVDLLSKATTPRGEIAILESKSNAIFIRGVNQEELLFQAQRGAYRAFWDEGFSVDFITPEHLADPEILDYRIICLPLMGLISVKHAGLLEKYVSAGGILIAFARFGTLNENGWMHFDLPLESLGNVFGIDHIEADTLDDQKIEFQDQLYQGKMNRDITKIKESTDILASFTDGNPAVTRATLNKGFGVYINTQADIAYLDNPSNNLLREIIHKLTSDHAINPRISMKSAFNRARGIDPHILETEDKTLILFSNYLEKADKGDFQLSLRNRKPGELNQIYPDQSSLNYDVRDDYLSIPLEFEQKEVVILELSWT